MKKIISFILSLAMVTTLSFTLTACGECEHTLGDWSVTKDATCQVKGSKQKVCTKCGEVVETEEIAIIEHDYNAQNVCTMCGDVKVDTKTKYSNACDNIVEEIETIEEEKTSGITPLSFNVNTFSNISELPFKEVSSSGELSSIKGATSFVKLLANLLKNDDFDLTDKPVHFTYKWVVEQVEREVGEATLMYSFDEANNKIKMWWDVDSNSGISIAIFLYLEVDYNFETQTMGGFKVYSSQVVEMGNPPMSQTMNIGFIYDEGKLYCLDMSRALEIAEKVTPIIEGYKQELTSQMDKLIDLNADFTNEYTAMMNYMNGIN